MLTSWSLITVSYNSATTLKQYWSAERPERVEWIVVDNGSSDDSVAVAESLGARVIRAGENLGFSAANNVGLSSACGDYIACVNPDIRVDYATLDALARFVDESGGLVAPQLMNDDGSVQPNGRGMPLLAHKVRNRLPGHAAPAGYHVTTDASEARYAFWVIGAAVAATAKTWREVRGWNQRFFLYYEDKDLSIRAWRAGHSVIVFGGVRWTHGWARETRRFRLMPWIRELDSLARFYSRYPELLFGGRGAALRHHDATTRSGLAYPCSAGDGRASP